MKEQTGHEVLMGAEVDAADSGENHLPNVRLKDPPPQDINCGRQARLYFSEIGDSLFCAFCH